MENSDRMAIDEALTTLICETDTPQMVAAKLVISHREKFPAASPITTSGTRKPDAENLSSEWSIGRTKARIGSYRIWRQKGDPFGRELIMFHHFWKSSVSTGAGENRPDRYYLCYDRRTLEVSYFGIEKRFAFDFFLIFGSFSYTAVLWGKVKYSWFPSIGLGIRML